MLKAIKGIFNEETEIMETMDLTEKMNGIDESFKIDNATSAKNIGQRSVVKVYQPVTKTVTLSIIDAIKKGELCIVNLDKVSDEEAKIIYSTLSGSIYSLDGVMKLIEQKILLCAPRNFIIDGDVKEA